MLSYMLGLLTLVEIHVEPTQALVHAREAVEVARRSGATSALINPLAMVAAAGQQLDPDEALAAAEECIRLDQTHRKAWAAMSVGTAARLRSNEGTGDRTRAMARLFPSARLVRRGLLHRSAARSDGRLHRRAGHDARSGVLAAISRERRTRTGPDLRDARRGAATRACARRAGPSASTTPRRGCGDGATTSRSSTCSTASIASSTWRSAGASDPRQRALTFQNLAGWGLRGSRGQFRG